MTSPMTETLTPPIALKWKKSKYLGYTATRGHHLSWVRGDVFPEATQAWVSFRAEHNDDRTWTLRVWTHTATNPSLVMHFDRLGECKEAASLLAAVVAWFDDVVVSEREYWNVDSWLKGSAHGVSLFVSYPEQRDHHDVKRLAEYGVGVTL